MKEQLRYDIFISGKYVDLFVLNEEHALNTDWYNWFNDPETTAHTRHHRFPNTPEKQLRYFKTEIENSASRLQLGMMDKDQVFFGVISLSNINYSDQNAAFEILIGHKEYRSIKFAIEGISLLLNHAFSVLNIQRVYGGVHTKQLAEFYVRVLNFSHEGVWRKHIYKNNEFLDCHFVGILKDEYKPIEFDD